MGAPLRRVWYVALVTGALGKRNKKEGKGEGRGGVYLKSICNTEVSMLFTQSVSSWLFAVLS